jgi:hypothetical protein
MLQIAPVTTTDATNGTSTDTQNNTDAQNNTNTDASGTVQHLLIPIRTPQQTVPELQPMVLVQAQTTARMQEQERAQPIIQTVALKQVRLQTAPTLERIQTQTEQIRIPTRTAQIQTLAVINNLHSELFSKQQMPS